jgi:hypothetical protein
MEKNSLMIALSVALFVSVLSGCSPYRESSNIENEKATILPETTNVVIFESSMPDKKYKVIGPVEVSIKKLHLFHADPTKEQANEALARNARKIGADAVVNTEYKSGIGFTTWGYIDAKGLGVKLLD